jgi:hypothetical protein
MEKDGFAYVAAGGFAGACSTLATNPLDVIRTRLQASRGASGVAQKNLSAHITTLFQDGFVRGMTKGLASNVAASMPSNAIYLPAYRHTNSFLASKGMDCKLVPIASALSAVVVTNLTLSPMFVIRSQVQADGSKPMREVATRILKTEGPKGFYRGLMTNVCGRFVEEGLFWSSFEHLKRQTNEGTMSATNSFVWNAFAVMSLTSLSKMFGVIVAYPYNVVMTHIRTPNKVSGVYEHSRFAPTVSHIYRHDGVVGFYKGLLPQLMRGVVSKATQIYAFELAVATFITAAQKNQSSKLIAA